MAGSVDRCVVVAVMPEPQTTQPIRLPYWQSSVTRSLQLVGRRHHKWRAVERRGLNGLSQNWFPRGRSLYSGFNSQSDGRPLVAAFPNAHGYRLGRPADRTAQFAADMTIPVLPKAVDERFQFRSRERLLASHERPPNPFLRRPCQVGRPWRSSEQVMKVGH